MNGLIPGQFRPRPLYKQYNFFHRAFALLLGLIALAAVPITAQAAGPVLMVVSNQDFYYQEYSDTRSSLEAQGLEVVVAAATTEVAKPQDRRGQVVQPDLALSDVNADDYSAIVFVGGWGAASYQYAFEGTYHNAAYQPNSAVTAIVNDLINDFVHARKYVSAICHGVTVLAYARVDGASPIAGRKVTSWAGGGPGFELFGQSYPDSTVPDRSHIQSNGGLMPLSGAVGDPITSTDDVIVDGRIITAENYTSARWFGYLLGRLVLLAGAGTPETPAELPPTS